MANQRKAVSPPPPIEDAEIVSDETVQ